MCEHSTLMSFLCSRSWQAWIIVLICDRKFFVICSQCFKSISHLQLFLVVIGTSLNPLDWHFPMLMRVTGCFCLCALVDVNCVASPPPRYGLIPSFAQVTTSRGKMVSSANVAVPAHRLFIPLPLPLVNPFVPPLLCPLPLLP